MQLISIKIDDEVLADFDIVAKLNHRNRSVHIRELILTAIRLAVKKNPEAFKEKVE